MATAFQELTAHTDLISNLVIRDLKTRYRGSVLGFLWTILNPLFMAAIYIFFLRLLSRGIANQYENIIIGVFAWQYTVHCVNSGLNSITANASLVKKVAFPRAILPFASSLSGLVNFWLTLLVQWVLLALLLWFNRGEHLPWTTLLVPFFTLYHLLFGYSLALFLAAANVYFRDTEHIVGLLLSAWFFMSPVMYPLEMVSQVAAGHPWIASLYMLNPLTSLLTVYRLLQVPGTTFPWSWPAAIGLLLPLLLFAAASATFKRAQRNFADHL